MCTRAPGFRGGLFTFSHRTEILQTPQPGGLWLVVCAFFLSGSILKHIPAGILSTPKCSVCGFKDSGRPLASPCVVGDVPAEGGLSGRLQLGTRRLSRSW